MLFEICIAVTIFAQEIGLALGAVPPGTPTRVILVDGGNDSSLAIIWAPPTTGGDPTSYNVSINDSTGTTWTMPHDGSPSYAHTFAGLASNTLFSVTVVAINNAGSAGVTVNNYTLAKPPSGINGSCSLQGNSYDLMITWLPAINITSYQITCLDLNYKKSYARNEDCSVGPCYAFIDLDMAANLWRICIGSYNKRDILGIQNCSPNLKIDCSHNAEVSTHRNLTLLWLLLLMLCSRIFLF